MPHKNLERIWARIERSIAGLPDGPQPFRDECMSQDPARHRPSLHQAGTPATAGAAWRRAVALYLGGVLTGVPLATLLHTHILSRDMRVAAVPPPVAPRGLGSTFSLAANASDRSGAAATPQSPAEPLGGKAPAASLAAASAGGPDSPAADPSAHRAAAASTLAEERLLLDRARRALERDDARDALRWTDVHKARFARPELGEEREALAIQALAADGQYDEARHRAARFLSAAPNSLFRPAVETTLASIP